MTIKFIAAAAAVLTFLFVHKIVTSCPTVCICKWKGGKRRVECSDKGLTLILPGISADTQVLDYSRNQLLYLPSEVFQKEELINLQKLYLSGCQIAQIHENAFQGLANLIELDLSNNTLSNVPFKTFPHTSLLMKLSLSANPIHKLRTRQFVSIPYLTTLDLSNCQIDDIEMNTFEGLLSLQWLKLERNRLKNIHDISIIPKVSSGLSLYSNPWKCDCYLREFLRWLTTTRSLLTAQPSCEEPPKFRGIPIGNLEKSDLACLPYIVPSSSYVVIDEGKNISFVCQVSAIPEATISWEFEGIPVDNNTSIVYPFYKYYVEEIATEKISELFIFDAKLRNNGTYKCVAKNSAGNSSSIFVVRILEQEPSTPIPETVSYVHILFSSIITFGIIFILIAVTLCVVCYRKRISADKRNKFSKRKNQHYVILNRNPPMMTSTAEEIGEYRKNVDANPDLINNTDSLKETDKNENDCLLLADDEDAADKIVGSQIQISENEDVLFHQNSDHRRLFCNLQFEGARITLHLNPMENQIIDKTGLTYPCGCFYPIINQNVVGIFDDDKEEEEHYVTKRDSIVDDVIYPDMKVFSRSQDNANNDTRWNARYNNSNQLPPALDLSQTSSKTTPILSPPEPFKSVIMQD